MRRIGRVVEGARLESVCRGDSTVGSNPMFSAITTYLIELTFIHKASANSSILILIN